MWIWVAFGIVIVVGFVAFTGAPYVPSRRADVARAFDELYKLGSKDTLVDIGSGDGIVLRQASKRGARAVGYEIHPVLVVISRLLSRGDARVSVYLRNFWRAALPGDVTVVYTFGDGRDIKKMYSRVQAEATRLEKTIHFISYAFEIKGVVAKKTVGAHHLYTLKPLQESR